MKINITLQATKKNLKFWGLSFESHVLEFALSYSLYPGKNAVKSYE